MKRKATPEHLARMVGIINAMYHKPPVADNVWYYGLQAMGFMNDPPHKYMKSKSHVEVIQGMNPQQRDALQVFMKNALSMMR